MGEEYNKAGLYLWTFEIDKKKYKLYVGKASPRKRKGFVNRLMDYLNGFQPQSSNDFKIKHFDDYVRRKKLCSKVLYQIYYCTTLPEGIDLADFDTSVRSLLKPIFDSKKNDLQKPLRGLMQRVNQAMYDIYFDEKLK